MTWRRMGGTLRTPTAVGHSSIETYPGFDLSVQNHRQHPPAGHEYDTSELFNVSHASYVLRAEESVFWPEISTL